MSIAFNISMPKLEIEKDTRNIKVCFYTPKKASATPVTTVIDYWSITDHRGRVVRDAPEAENSYITADKYGKMITLIMEGAGYQIAYDNLCICIHFLTKDSRSVAIYYTYDRFNKVLAFSKKKSVIVRMMSRF